MFKKIGKYKLLQEIGYGSFSRVYLSEDDEGTKYAIKMINKENLSESSLEAIDKEIEILLQLSHPNIIQLRDVKKTPNNWYLVFDYCEYGDLGRFMKKHLKNGFPLEITQKIIQNLMKAMEELRKLNIVHRDLKLGNILLEENFDVKLADFGFARFQGEADIMMSFCGTPITMAPEILKRENYNEKCDLWSLGIIMYQLLFVKPPFIPKNMNNLSDALLEAIETQTINYDQLNLKSKSAKDFLKKTLEIDPNKRISFEEVFQHNFITEDISKNEPILAQLFQDIMEKVGNASVRQGAGPSVPEGSQAQFKPDLNNLDLPKSIAKLLFKKIEGKFINSQLKLVENLEKVLNSEPLIKEKYFSGIYLAYLILQKTSINIIESKIGIKSQKNENIVLELSQNQNHKTIIQKTIENLENKKKEISEQNKEKLEKEIQQETDSSVVGLIRLLVKYSNEILNEFENEEEENEKKEDDEEEEDINVKEQQQQNIYKLITLLCDIASQGQYTYKNYITLKSHEKSDKKIVEFLEKNMETQAENIKNHFQEEPQQIEDSLTELIFEQVDVEFSEKKSINKNIHNPSSSLVFNNQNVELIYRIFNDRIDQKL